MIGILRFARRENGDSTIDSICARCFRTVATERSEANLTVAEEKHYCDPNEEFGFRHKDS